MLLTEDYARAVVTYGRTAHRALLAAVREYEDLCDEYDVSTSGITITVHPTLSGVSELGEPMFVATCHLIGMEPN